MDLQQGATTPPNRAVTPLYSDLRQQVFDSNEVLMELNLLGILCGAAGNCAQLSLSYFNRHLGYNFDCALCLCRWLRLFMRF